MTHKSKIAASTLLPFAFVVSFFSARLHAQTPVVQKEDYYWYKNSIIYTLDVDTYQDSDGDGIGDFRGLIEKTGLPGSAGH